MHRRAVKKNVCGAFLLDAIESTTKFNSNWKVILDAVKKTALQGVTCTNFQDNEKGSEQLNVSKHLRF